MPLPGSVSVMHIAYYGTLPDDAKSLNLNAGRYMRLVKYIRDSFERNAAGRLCASTNTDSLADDVFLKPPVAIHFQYLQHLATADLKMRARACMDSV